MAVLKVACSKCGQRVSGDDTFFGTTVECPVCSSTIRFPENPNPPVREAPPATPEQPPRQDDPPAFTEMLLQMPSTASQRSAAPAGSPPPMEKTSIPITPQPHAQPPAPAEEKGGGDLPSPVLGVVSMVLGIVSVMLFCVPGILFGPAAIIAGHIALAKARRVRARLVPGKSAAITGLILGYLSLVGFIVALLALRPVVEAIRNSAPPGQ